MFNGRALELFLARDKQRRHSVAPLFDRKLPSRTAGRAGHPQNAHLRQRVAILVIPLHLADRPAHAEVVAGTSQFHFLGGCLSSGKPSHEQASTRYGSLNAAAALPR